MIRVPMPHEVAPNAFASQVQAQTTDPAAVAHQDYWAGYAAGQKSNTPTPPAGHSQAWQNGFFAGFHNKSGLGAQIPATYQGPPVNTSRTLTSLLMGLTRISAQQIVEVDQGGSATNFYADGSWTVVKNGHVIRSGNDNKAHWNCFAPHLSTIGSNMSIAQAKAAWQACYT